MPSVSGGHDSRLKLTNKICPILVIASYQQPGTAGNELKISNLFHSPQKNISLLYRR
jgi:hypothetical protein